MNFRLSQQSPLRQAIIIGVVVTVTVLLVAGLAAAGTTPQAAPPLACSGAIDPILGGRVDCKPWTPTSSASIYPLPTTATNTASPTAAATTPASPTPAPSTTTPKPSPTPTATSPKPTPSTTKSSPGGTVIQSWLTGYSGAGDDNSCGGHGGDCVAFEDIQAHAGGNGTYADPLTVAISENDWKSGHFKPGDLFYIPWIQRYAVASDYCGNSDNADCSKHANHLDIWTGENGSDQCMEKMDNFHVVIFKPGPGYLVPNGGGPLDETGCKRYSDAVVLA